MINNLERKINALLHSPTLHLACEIKRGIEKEALRVTPEGNIATTPHPHGLGSKLTHPTITTDYSESQLEIITPPTNDPHTLIKHLESLHAFIVREIGDEILWSVSMPCALHSEDDIIIADYGTSNSGQMKHIYRRGLAHRYGKRMQTISGLHYNLSFPRSFWTILQSLTHNESLFEQDFINQQYMGLIRNFCRMSWFIIALFGASPAICQSYTQGNSLHLQHLGKDTLYLPYATSLRMSDIGYQNAAQEHLMISYNSLADYVHDLNAAITTPDPRYQRIGVCNNKSYQQLNTHILQIEAEYYGPIRPKRSTGLGMRPSKALHEQGIEYIEVRALDVNPYAPCGIDLAQIRLLETFLLYCQLLDSPMIDEQTHKAIEENQRRIVLNGRDEKLCLIDNNKERPINEWKKAIIKDLQSVSAILDVGMANAPYRAAIDAQCASLDDPSQYLSARMIADVKTHDNSFTDFAMAISKQHQATHRQYAFTRDELNRLKQESAISLEQQRVMEEHDTLSLAQYIAQYFA